MGGSFSIEMQIIVIDIIRLFHYNMNKFIMSICFKNPTLDSKRKRKVVWQIIGVHHLTKKVSVAVLQG